MCNHTNTYSNALNRIILSLIILICTGGFRRVAQWCAQSHHRIYRYARKIIWTISTYKNLRFKHVHLKVTMFKETSCIYWSIHAYLMYGIDTGFYKGCCTAMTWGRRVLIEYPAFLCWYNQCELDCREVSTWQQK